MAWEIRIVALLLAGMLSCQQVPEVEMEQQEAPQETTAATEPEIRETPMTIYPGWLPLSCTAVLPEEDMGRVLVDQVPEHNTFPHTFTVYLPPHYDESEKYNLLIFLGPFQGPQGGCVDKFQSTWYTEIFRFRTVYDHLILEGKVQPFIMVQPDYLAWKDLTLGYDTIALSIKEELLPYLAENYSTYAEDGSYQSLVAAREHVVMGGASLGGMYTLGGLLPNCIDVAASFCPMSCNINLNGVKNKVLESARQYPLKRLTYTVGSLEEPNMKYMKDHLLSTFPELLDQQTFIPMELDGTFHHYSTWAAGLWNSLQFIFRDEEPDPLAFEHAKESQ